MRDSSSVERIRENGAEGRREVKDNIKQRMGSKSRKGGV